MSTTYVVKSGDTLSAIALKHQVKGGYQALASYNNISNPNAIRVGQKIVIPGGQSSTGGATSGAAASSVGGKVKVTASALNVRTGAGTENAILGVLKNGQVVAYSGEQSGWLKISYQGQTGWIAKKYTEQSSAAPSPAASDGQNAAAPKTMYVKASALNVRNGAGTNNAIVGTLYRGAAVSVLNTSNGWAKINYGSGSAYVSAKYLSTTKQSSGGGGSSSYQPSNGSAYALDPNKLAKVASGASKYYSQLVGSMGIANISSRLRACGYIAQLAHESVNFLYMEEIASGDDYEGREDLGNTQPGDGRRYKGRGPIQITGRYNYTKASKALGIDLVNHPELASDPEIGFKLSAWYWNTNNLNSYCDNDDFVGLTRAINGGTNGLADRREYYNRAKQYL